MDKIIGLIFISLISAASSRAVATNSDQCKMVLGEKSIFSDLDANPSSPEKTAALEYKNRAWATQYNFKGATINEKIKRLLFSFTSDRNTENARIWADTTQLPAEDLNWIYDALRYGYGAFGMESKSSKIAHQELIDLLGATIKYVTPTDPNELPPDALTAKDGRVFVFQNRKGLSLGGGLILAPFTMGASLLAVNPVPAHLKEVKKRMTDETELKAKLDDQHFRSQLALMIFSKKPPR